MDKRGTPKEKQPNYFLELIANLDDTLRRLDIPSEEVMPYLGGSESREMWEHIVHQVRADWQARHPESQHVPLDDGLMVQEAPSAFVSYVVPTYEELQGLLCPEHVNPDYKDSLFLPIDERTKTSREARELQFRYVRRPRHMSNAKTTLAMKRRGLLPALPEEARSFLKKHPQELRVNMLMFALGAQFYGRFLCAWRTNGGCGIDLRRTNYYQYGDYVFLAVLMEEVS